MTPLPLAGLLFMVFVGTFVAYTIFLRLVRDWGAPRAGLFSFVSPVVALILGAIVLGEPLDLARDRRGGAIMLSRQRRSPVMPRSGRQRSRCR